ncbi:MAG: MoxR family ATPase [Pseudomonadales bacterium]|nr:MoxR family ATPase [Pseudomonadales bacterium]
MSESSPTLIKVKNTIQWLDSRIIGQQTLVERLVLALLCGGHLLVEGAPGLAKTRAIKELANVVEGDFHRIQFTPDLLPSDVTGTEIYRPEDGSFIFQKGPVFHNLLLADEINRAPAKVQSALLEAMGEKQVSIGRETFPLPELFLVMATQNPIEQEGTYPLPEAQLDRFLMHLRVDFPNKEAEHKILQLVRGETLELGNQEPVQMIAAADIFAARKEIISLHMADSVEEYLVQLIMATRNPQAYGEEIARWIDYGASPRGTIAMDLCSRAVAWLDGRTFVTPEDVQAVVHDTLRHRLILSFEADAQGITADKILDDIVEIVPVP